MRSHEIEELLAQIHDELATIADALHTRWQLAPAGSYVESRNKPTSRTPVVAVRVVETETHACVFVVTDDSRFLNATNNGLRLRLGGES